MSSTGLVMVKVPILDGDGVHVAEDEKDVQRNTGRWMSCTVNGRLLRVHGGPKRHRPMRFELTPTNVFSLPQSLYRSVVVATQRVDEERALHLAVLTAAMREQGRTQ